MDVAGEMILAETVRALAAHWPLLSGEDPNLQDLKWLAKEVSGLRGVECPKQLFGETTGLRIVEAVEQFVSGVPVRDLEAEELARRTKSLLLTVGEVLPNVEPEAQFVLALCTWHGCTSMAKCTRTDDVVSRGTGPYTLEFRLAGYKRLLDDVEDASKAGNPWILYGTTLAWTFSKLRGELPEEDWIAATSPYWRRHPKIVRT